MKIKSFLASYEELKHISLITVIIICTLTAGRNSFNTAIFPYIPTSLIARNPSGVTKKISRREFLATIKFKSVSDVKFPVTIKMYVNKH